MSISDIDFQSMIDGENNHKREGEKRVRGISAPLNYFSTIASTGQTSTQLPHSVHFSSLIV
jgi:hypothetical protein